MVQSCSNDMKNPDVPDYADLDNYTYSQRIAVVVRWFVLGTWFILHNYRAGMDPTYFTNSSLALMLAAINGYLHWRIWRGLRITKPYAIVLSAMDLTFITVGIAASSAFGNTFFVLYYPALVGMSLAFHSRRLTFAGVSAVALAYGLTSIYLEPGIDIDASEEKVLAVRIVCMYAVVAAANLMSRIERTRRIEAVEAERSRAGENLELQKKAQEAEVAALKERGRIAREIHDGIAQSIYMLSLNLETLSEVADREDGKLRDRIHELVPLAKQTLLETRHYIFDLKPVLAGERGIVDLAENQAKEFQTVAGTPVELSVRGEPRQVSAAAGAGVYRIMQEALANVFKHANASSVNITLAFENGSLRLSLQDDGSGFSPDQVTAGYGLDNMRQRAKEMGGTCKILSAPGDGTIVTFTLPTGPEEV